MARLTRLVCLMAVAALILCFISVARELPAPSDDLVERKYARWGGVLRLWACEGWASGNGTLSAWLNAVSERFERRRDGVYVQIDYVSEDTLRAFAYGTRNPPDMILFAPGMLASGEDLMYTELSKNLRRELRGYADGLALPVAMGGYAWAVNRYAAPEGAPDGALIVVPPAETYRAWHMAALLMLTGDAVYEQESAPDTRLGVDLGLPAPEAAPEISPEARAVKRKRIVAGEGSSIAHDAYQRFAGGQASVLAVTQRELRRLQTLSDAGRAPDWMLTFTGQMYADQLALIGIVDVPRADIGDRQQACREFLEYVISEEGQKLLGKSRAFQVIDAPALYANQMGMAQMEKALIERELIIEEAFTRRDAGAASAALERVLAGEIDAQSALEIIWDGH